MNAPQSLAVMRPENAAPAPIPADLDEFLDSLPLDGDAFWVVARGIEWAYRLGYADGHARGYRDRSREKDAENKRPSEQTVRAIPKATS